MNAIYEKAFRMERINSIKKTSYAKDNATITICRETEKRKGFFGVEFVLSIVKDDNFLSAMYEYTERAGIGIRTRVDCFIFGDAAIFGLDAGKIDEIAAKNNKRAWHAVFDDKLLAALMELDK